MLFWYDTLFTMPNGKYDNTSKKPGKYRCISCGETKTDAEFYKDRSRYNGCSSRCKLCQKALVKDRRPVKKTPDYFSTPPRRRRKPTSCKSGHANTEKRGVSCYYKYAKDIYGIPYQIEKKYYKDGQWLRTEFISL